MRMLFCALLLLTAVSAQAQRIVFTKVFPKSLPAYVKITLTAKGEATFQDSADEPDPVKFTVDAATTAKVFELAGKLDHFKGKLESGLKVAKTGDKTFRWEEGATVSEATFNYSENTDARELQDWFEKMSETERLLDQVTSTYRFDRLGVNDVLLLISKAWTDKRLISPQQFVPILDRIHKNEAVLNMARDRAASLSEAIQKADAAEKPAP